MLAAIERVLAPGAQVSFHHPELDAFGGDKQSKAQATDINALTSNLQEFDNSNAAVLFRIGGSTDCGQTVARAPRGIQLLCSRRNAGEQEVVSSAASESSSATD